MDVKVIVGRPKELNRMKNGDTPLGFNVCVVYGEAALVFSGFRLMNGRIMPPTYTSSWGKYVPLVYMSAATCQALLDELRKLDWRQYKNVAPLLDDDEEALAYLKYNRATFDLLFPEMRGGSFYNAA